MRSERSIRRWVPCAGLVWVTLVCLVQAPLAAGQPPAAKKGKQKPASKPAAAAKRPAAGQSASATAQKTPALPKNLDQVRPVRVEGQLQLPRTTPFSPGKQLSVEALEEIYAQELMDRGVPKASKRIDDDRFVRRVYLDLVGSLPPPDEIERYLRDESASKKEKLVDALLADNRYGWSWARYWRDVIGYRSTGTANRFRQFDMVPWLADQLNQNADWGEIVTGMLTARGPASQTPQAFFIAAHDGKAEELAGEITRVFLGVQIGCAQCHDHPTDSWRRTQFHQMASFFGKTDVRQVGGKGGNRTFGVVEDRKAVYRMPDAANPQLAGEIVAPVFLTGQPIPNESDDQTRRNALARFLTSKQNPYFAKAFVNPIWAELVGYGFTNPVDDLSPQRPVVYPKLFEALAGSFRASDYDIKKLIRTIVLSRIYDRQFAGLEGSYDEETLFWKISPTRLRSDQIRGALVDVLAMDERRQSGPSGPRNRTDPFREAFGFDPSTDPAEVEGSIPQALLMMNHPLLNEQIDADRAGTVLAKLLAQHADPHDLIEALYLRVLARRPTQQEQEIAYSYVASLGDRRAAFEDLFWALLNSTEFLHNH